MPRRSTQVEEPDELSTIDGHGSEEHNQGDINLNDADVVDEQAQHLGIVLEFVSAEKNYLPTEIYDTESCRWIKVGRGETLLKSNDSKGNTFVIAGRAMQFKSPNHVYPR